MQGQQETRCPGIFTIVPAGRKKLTGSPYELHLYCEESGAWHPLPYPAGCYPITQPAQWLRTLGPYLQHLLTAFKHIAPLAGPILGITVDKLNEQIKFECDLMKELTSQMPDEVRFKNEMDETVLVDTAPKTLAANDGDFRGIEAMITKLDPNRIWGRTVSNCNT